ncbi:MAG TPA: archaellin/type IV pilin N-terminal domain-containing protein [Thermoplasmata archaeon]|nr:archaellin/type IV pilin N-terminal domain-containing protein [Thermoplasmata archaeon]
MRKNGRRGVSPIIATILLVAITVVLAAVLYVLISGLTRGPGNTPIGSALGTGSAKFVTGTGAVGCLTGDSCYAIPIASASGGVTVASMNLQIKTSSGTVYLMTGTVAGGANVTGLSGSLVAGGPVGKASGYSLSTWTTGTSTTVLASSMTIWLDLGQPTTSPAGTGLTLYIYGVGSYSGQVTVGLP